MPKSLLTYSSFVIYCLVVIAAFITATNYMQLAVAVILYPLLAYFAFKAFPRKTRAHHLKHVTTNQPPEKPEARRQDVGISDINKRAFLKLVGATGLSFFLISVFGRKVETLLFGQYPASRAPRGNAPGVETSAPIASASPTDSYKISEIDDGIVSYYGFIDVNGGWFIMKGDTNSGSFRYAKGNSDFPGSWENREHLKYDYFYNVFF